MKKLAKEGVEIVGNNGGNYFRLEQGNALFSPTSDITVGTKIGIVQLAANACVYITTTANNVAIYSLHENAPGDVTVYWDNNTLEVEPGHMLALTEEKSSQPGQSNGVSHSICYGAPEKVAVDESMKAFLADRSIASAVKAFIRLQCMLEAIEKNKQMTAVQVLKSAETLEDLVKTAEPLGTERIMPAQPVRAQ
jgi:hypothetical protein